MARISLIICDLCKNKMNDSESQEEYSVTLSSLNETETIAEVCTLCYKSLLNRIKSPEKLTVNPPSAPVSTPKALEKAEKKQELEVAPITDENRPTEATEQLLDIEIKRVPSNFNRAKAIKAVKAMKTSGCPHHFKGFRDGAIVCIDAPPELQGELSGTRGCGEKVPAVEYTVNKPKHYTFKA